MAFHKSAQRVALVWLRKRASTVNEWLEMFAAKGRKSPVNMIELEAVLDTLPGFDLKQGSWAPEFMVGIFEYDDISAILKGMWTKLSGRQPLPNGRNNTYKVHEFDYDDRLRSPAELKGQLQAFRAQWKRLVTVVSAPPSNPKSGVVYSTEPELEKVKGIGGGTEWAVTAKLWYGLDGWVLTTPAGKTAMTTPIVGRGSKAAPEDLRAITNKKFLKRLYMALYSGKLYQVAKAVLAGEAVNIKMDGDKVQVVKVIQEASPAVLKVLKEITDKTIRQVAQSFLKNYLDLAQEWEQQPNAPSAYQFFRSRKYLMGDSYEALSRMLVEELGGYHLRPNYKAIAQAEADKNAERLRADFLSKNGFKLGAIVNTKQKKSNVPLTGAKVLSTGAHLFEGDTLFTFDDGSSFQVRNKTVIKQSPQGRTFAQYPTTFHKVILPDGKPMSSPSEARMVTVFAES